jgi:lactate permease
MLSLLALLPCAAVIVAILLLRLSGVVAAALALAVALVLWSLDVFSPMATSHLTHALGDAVVLGLLVGVVIVTGLLFVEVSGRGGALKAIDGVIQALSLSPPKVVILIVIGVGVMLESLTGFGVSMLVTIPLLLQVTDRKRAIGLGLIGMSLMPWGALSVSALLGAELAGVTVPALAQAYLTTSGPVAFVLPAACMLLLPGAGWRDVPYALLAGGALVAGIAATSYGVGVEVAGVGGGLAVLLLSSLFAAERRNLVQAITAPALLPYILLIAAVVAQKLLLPVLAVVGINPVLTTGRVSFYVLTSPGVALLSISLVFLVLRPSLARASTGPALHLHLAKRSWRVLVSIYLFLVTARLLVETEGIAALAGLLATLGEQAAVVAVTFLGGVGAYATGSGSTSNALFMPSAAATGESLDALALFAALQHSAAGHAAMASLPIIAILIAAMPNREATDERSATKIGLGLTVVWLVIVSASGAVQMAMS